jgi:N-acetylmuramoyl-L-alanine amidase CwlA
VDKMQIQYNKSLRTQPIKYIVIHETGNTKKGANAMAHFNYFNTADRKSSADYFVDDTQILKVNDYNKYYTWAVGDGKGKYSITNNNSLSIEICVNSDGDYGKAVSNTVLLVKELMQELGIDLEHIVTHYDASRKNCPTKLLPNWKEFKKRLSPLTNKEKAIDIINNKMDTPQIWIERLDTIPYFAEFILKLNKE